VIGPSVRTYMRFDDWDYLKTTVRRQIEFPGVLQVRDVLRGWQNPWPSLQHLFSASSAERLQR